MGHRIRRHYTQAEKSEMWDRWQEGESMNEIGRHFGVQGHSSIQRIFAETGGIRPEAVATGHVDSGPISSSTGHSRRSVRADCIWANKPRYYSGGNQS